MLNENDDVEKVVHSAKISKKRLRKIGLDYSGKSSLIINSLSYVISYDEFPIDLTGMFNGTQQ